MDETYIGGKARNMHKWQRNLRIRGRGYAAKTAVQGARERETGRVTAEVIFSGPHNLKAITSRAVD